MHVLCAPDKFKGSLSAVEAANCMAAGISRIDSAITVDVCPVADGGEGTIDVVTRAFGDDLIRVYHHEVAGPLGRDHPVGASWMMLDIQTEHPTAVIELASAAGLGLIDKPQRNPMNTTTFGVGELIIRAFDAGARTVMVALGGSASCDGGCGLAQALGVRFTLSTGETLDSTTRAITGRDLSIIKEIHAIPPYLINDKNQLTGLYDVHNPLFGREGAAYVYAPQKGAGDEEVRQLDRGLAHLARCGVPHADPTIPGAGAAGGAGFGLRALCGATLQPGIDTILDIIHFDTRLSCADVVITGEGCLDVQSLYGKAILGIAERAQERHLPVLAVVGSIDPEFLTTHEQKLHEILTSWQALDQLPGVVDTQDSIRRAQALVTKCTEETVRRYLSLSSD